MDREFYREEAEYIIYLLHERRLYAWCLQKFGSFRVEEAYREAASLYKYHPIEFEERESIFEEEAWHWAMSKLHGNYYFETKPKFAHPTAAYRRESDRIFGYE